MAQIGQREIRVVLLGAAGAGKSATGNSFLRREAFKESENPRLGTAVSVTEEIHDIIQGYKLSVTDTPGLCSTSTNEAITCAQITQFIGQLCPGPHVIALVVSAGQRVSQEIQTTINIFCKMFGERSVDHMMFIFTKIDLLTTRFNPHPRPIEDWIDQLCNEDKIFEDIFNRCGRRFASIDNRKLFGSVDYVQQIARIMESFISLVRTNNGLYYTNEEFSVIEKLLKELDEKTGDRSESRQQFTSYVVAVGSGLTGGAALGAAGAVAGPAGAALLSTEAAVSALGGAILGGSIAVAGSVAIAGISLVSWGVYKGYSAVFAEKVREKIKQS